MTETHPADITADKASASWKFDFLDTVNADPLANGACLAVVKAYLNFASHARPQAFCAIPELMVRTGLTKPTLIKAKATLERLGYMTQKFVTDEGAVMYELVNARKQLIDEHLHIARQVISNQEKDRKVRERKASHGGKISLPPETARGSNIFTPSRKESLPNTLEEYPGVIFLEGEAINQGIIASPATAYADIDDDPHQPFPKPIDDHDAVSMIDSICAGKDVGPSLRKRLKCLLNDAVLTPNMVGRMLAQLEEAA